jgi:hypothetical protein
MLMNVVETLVSKGNQFHFEFYQAHSGLSGAVPQQSDPKLAGRILEQVMTWSYFFSTAFVPMPAVSTVAPSCLTNPPIKG